MRILQIIPNFEVGGAETMCESLCYCLKRSGNDVVAVSLYSEDTLITERLSRSGIKIVFLNKRSGFDVMCVKRLHKLIKEISPDVIHTHLYSLKYAILATLFSNIKIVHTLHNIATEEASKRDRLFNGFFFRNRKVVPVALSESNKSTIIKEYGLSQDVIPVVFNGVNMNNCIVKQNYKKNDIFTIICVARFSPQKNHLRLIKAFSMFSLTVPNSRLVLVGDGELKNEIREKIKELNLEDKVVLTGLQSNVYPFLTNADIFSLSSDYEGLPMTLIEAMGTGLPIVSTNVGGIQDILKNGEDALLTDTSSDALNKAYASVYNDDSLREKLGRNALVRSNEYSANRMSKEYTIIYKGLIDND